MLWRIHLFIGFQDLVANNLLVNKARIFAMTSSGSHSTIPYYGAVSAAKASLESHIRQLSAELGSWRLPLMLLWPVLQTLQRKKIPGNVEMIEVARRKNPRRRLTSPEDVAQVISVLCQDGAEWISGGVINADGGEDNVSYVGQGEPTES